MEYKKLSECADFRNERTKQIDFETYISTENMLPNKAGVSTAESLPDVKTTTKYLPKDILLSNIRPYFKKIWFSNREGGCSNDVLVVTAKQGVNPNYLYYVLSDNNFFNYDTITSKGTKMPRGTPKAIMKYLVPDVDKDYQDKIVFILSRYDSLIEKNNKRIKVLEQMAENLYKEWFVRFRFPGYENAEFENGIPKGWILSTANSYYAKKPRSWHFGNVSEFGEFKRGKNITSTEMIEGDIPVISAGLEPSGYHCDFNVTGKNITVSASGANAGYIKYNLDNIWAADCSYYQDEKYLWYVYNTLKFLQPVLKNMQCGAAQPHVYPKHINHLNVIIPADDIILKYCQIVNPLYDEIKIIHDNNINLIKQRDLLLPRLMSGKLEV